MDTKRIEAFANEMSDSVDLAMELVKDIRLPPQPTVVAAVSDELSKSNPDFKRITELVEKDPSLVSRVLRIINSPLFGLKREVTSIKTSLSLLGLKNFYSMVMTSAVKDALGFRDQEMERLWAHSLLVAKLSQQIAQRVDKISEDEAYLVGLFHDSAIPVLVNKFPEYKVVVEKVTMLGGDIRDYEELHFNTHHALVAGLLGRTWGLPVHMCKAIRFHHADSLAALTDPKARGLGAVLTLADYLSRESFSVQNGKKSADVESARWRVLLDEISEELQFNDFSELQQQADEMVLNAA